MKILCLHGFRHNSALLQKSMGTMMTCFKKANIEFDFLDSNISYTSAEPVDEKANFRQWWSATKDSVTNLTTFDTIEDSLKTVLKKWDDGKYDGILGFSQGSVLAQIFAYRIQNGIFKTYAPKFVILCSTFSITDTNEKKMYEKKLDYPCVIMYGEKDTFVTDELTLQVSAFMANPFLIKHKGGHYVSTTKETTDSLLEFLIKFK